MNAIIPQYTKCEFIAINGDASDIQPLPFGSKLLKNVQYITLLGSHLSSHGTLTEDLKHHMQTRYTSSIKYFNFLKANQLAPLSVKLKVLKACVVNSLLYNCETFGNTIPYNLENTYNKLLRCTFNVRTSTPTLTLYIESGFLPIKALITARQLKFFNRYKECHPRNSLRVDLFHRLMGERIEYIQHYVDISNKYNKVVDVYKASIDDVKRKIRKFAENDDHYKYQIYLKINPELKISPFINNFHPLNIK